MTQYQVKAEPPVQPSAASLFAGWMRQPSDPIRRPGLPVAVISALIVPLFIAPSVLGSWTNTPTQARAGLASHLQLSLVAPVSTSPESTSEDRWHQPLSIPQKLYNPGLLASLQLSYVGVISTSPEAVLESKWHQPLSYPLILSKLGLGSQFQQSYVGPVSTLPESVETSSWLTELSRPSWKLGTTALRDSFSFGGLPTIPVGWYAPSEELPKVKADYSRVLSQAAFTWSGFTPATAVTISLDWLQQLSLPTVKPSTLQITHNFVWSGFTPLPVVSWFDQNAEAKGRVDYTRALNAQAFAWSSFTPATVATISLGWLQQLSTPTAKATTAQASYSYGFAWSEFTPPISIDWLPENADPQRAKQDFSRVLGQQANVWSAFTPLPVVGWFGQNVDLRARADYSKVLSVPAFTWSYFTPTPVTISIGWLQQFPEQQNKTLRALQLDYSTSYVIPPIAPSLVWFQQLSLPVRFPSALKTALHPAFFIDPKILTQKEAVEAASWEVQLSVPVRVLLRTPDYNASFWSSWTPDNSLKRAGFLVQARITTRLITSNVTNRVIIAREAQMVNSPDQADDVRAGDVDLRGYNLKGAVQDISENFYDVIVSVGIITAKRADNKSMTLNDLSFTPVGKPSPGVDSTGLIVSWWQTSGASIAAAGPVTYLVNVPFTTLQGRNLSRDFYQIVQRAVG